MCDILFLGPIVFALSTLSYPKLHSTAHRNHLLTFIRLFLVQFQQPCSPNTHHIHSFFVPFVLACLTRQVVPSFLWSLSEKKVLFFAILVLTSHPSSISLSSSTPDHHAAILYLFFTVDVCLLGSTTPRFLFFPTPPLSHHTLALSFSRS